MFAFCVFVDKIYVGCPGAVDSCPTDGLGNDMTNNFMVCFSLQEVHTRKVVM